MESRGTINRVIIEGYVGRNPEFRLTTNGHYIATFSVATNRGESQTDWHYVVCFDSSKMDDIINNINKGDKVHIEGNIQYRRVNNITYTSIVAEAISIVQKKQTSTSTIDRKATIKEHFQQNTQVTPQDKFQEFKRQILNHNDEDDIPF